MLRPRWLAENLKLILIDTFTFALFDILAPFALLKVSLLHCAAMICEASDLFLLAKSYQLEMNSSLLFVVNFYREPLVCSRKVFLENKR